MNKPIGFHVIILFQLLPIFLWGGQSSYCALDSSVLKVYREILNLNLIEARSIIGNKAKTDPNKIYLLLDNEIDFYQLYVYDQHEAYLQKKTEKEKRIELVEESDLPLQWKQFIKAEILLQWSLLHLRENEEYKAFQSIRQSILLLENNVKRFPDFIYSYKSLGILHTLLSTIPQSYQWAAGLLGLNGNLNTGKQELQKYIEFAEPIQDIFLDESYAAMSFIISFLENKPEHAYIYWNFKMKSIKTGPLHTLIQCKLAMKSGMNDLVLKSLQPLDDSQKSKLPVLYYLHGMASLQSLNTKSEYYFKQFLKLYNGTSYIKEVYQKLAWNSLLKGDVALYHLYISNCLTKGIANTDDEKQAMGEATSGLIPDIHLLKSRLLFDGGYYHKAGEILFPMKESFYADPYKKLECAYRLGRIYQMNKDLDSALKYFDDAISFDPDQHSYLSCNSLLQTAIIFENQNKNKEAYQYYLKVLKTQPLQYQKSLHQKAKAGIARL